MQYFWSLAQIAGIGIYAVLDIGTTTLKVYQSNNDRVLAAWDDVSSPNTGHLYEWAMANAALPLVNCVSLEEARGSRAPEASTVNPALEIPASGDTPVDDNGLAATLSQTSEIPEAIVPVEAEPEAPAEAATEAPAEVEAPSAGVTEEPELVIKAPETPESTVPVEVIADPVTSPVETNEEEHPVG